MLATAEPRRKEGIRGSVQERQRGRKVIHDNIGAGKD
jgi:hypothetical protein